MLTVLNKGNSVVLVTTDDDLQNSIISLRRYQQCYELGIFASSHIEMISFQVPSRFKNLMVLRCGSNRRSGSSSRVLLINSASSFSDIRVDQWQQKKRANKFILGSNVGIEVGNDWSFSTESFAANLSGLNTRQKVEEYLDQMEKADKKGAWWEEWKGSIAAILALVAGGTKFAIGLNAAAKGMMVHFQWGPATLTIVRASFNFQTVATAAGPAVLLGVGVAAAVYFIPWKNVFTWLEKNIFRRFGSCLQALWDQFQSWVRRQMKFFDKTSRIAK